MPLPKALFSISRRDLELHPKEISDILPVSWLNQQLDFASLGVESHQPSFLAKQEGAVQLKLTLSGDEQVLLQGQVNAPLESTCGRCLGPAHVPIHTQLSILLVPKVVQKSPKGRSSQESENEFEFDPSEADVSTYEGETIVLDELIREAIVLELPISPLCSEDCKGMASDPAIAEKLKAARVDPRFAPLAALRDSIKKQ